MKILVREKVREIVTLAMLRDNGSYNILVSYMFKNLRVIVHVKRALVFDKKIDLQSYKAEEELEELKIALQKL